MRLKMMSPFIFLIFHLDIAYVVFVILHAVFIPSFDGYLPQIRVQALSPSALIVPTEYTDKIYYTTTLNTLFDRYHSRRLILTGIADFGHKAPNPNPAISFSGIRAESSITSISNKVKRIARLTIISCLAKCLPGQIF